MGAPAARRAVVEVLDCFREDVDEFIVARHRELQQAGMTNEQAFQQLSAELPTLRFVAPNLTLRQLRRRIYG